MAKRKGPTVNLDDSIAYHIHLTARLLRASFLRMGKSANIDLHPEQWFILNKLYKREGQTQVELTDSIFQDRANITRILNAMEKRGLVTRENDAQDKRVHRIYLTEKAISLHDEFVQIVVKERHDLFEGLSGNDFDEFRRILGVLQQNMSKKYGQI